MAVTEPGQNSKLHYRVELLVIRLRDLLRAPAKVLVEAGVRKGMTVLDFGCGPGGFSLAAAKLVGTEGRVYALDVQPLALRAVRRAAIRHAACNLQPIVGSRMGDIPGESVDMVLLYDVLHIHPAPDRIREIRGSIYRVLKPNGLLSIRDHYLDDLRLQSMVTEESYFRFYSHSRWSLQFQKIEKRKGAS